MIVAPIATQGVNDATLFGSTGVALSQDGKTALIADAGADINGATAVGAAFVMSDVSGTWTQEAELTRPSGDTAHAGFGLGGVALSADGKVAMVVQLGYGVFIFADVGGTWKQEALLQSGLSASQLLGFQYGFTSALSRSGTTVAIGANDSLGTTPVTAACPYGSGGDVYFYSDIGGTWTPESTYTHCSGWDPGEQLTTPCSG